MTFGTVAFPCRHTELRPGSPVAAGAAVPSTSRRAPDCARGPGGGSATYGAILDPPSFPAVIVEAGFALVLSTAIAGVHRPAERLAGRDP